MFDISDLRIVIKPILLILVTLISFALGMLISHFLQLSDAYLSGLWAAISAIIVFDDFPTTARELIKDRLLGTFIGALLTAITYYLIGDLLIAVCISLFFVYVLIVKFKWMGALKIGCITVLIIAICSHNEPFSAIWRTSFMRFFESAIGGVISLLATVIIYTSKQVKSLSIPEVRQKGLRRLVFDQPSGHNTGFSNGNKSPE
ncbi:MAG: FUSC family protein [Candidatus Dadabacteria bacterium]